MPNLRQKIRDVFSWQHDTYEFEEEEPEAVGGAEGVVLRSNEEGAGENRRKKVYMELGHTIQGVVSFAS
jgi:hypothetical protein